MTGVTWATAPTAGDVADAAWFLTLLGGDARRVAADPIQCVYPAKDVLRAARLPVLLLAGTLDRPLILAEGYHRVCAAYLRDEATLVACHFLSA